MYISGFLLVNSPNPMSDETKFISEFLDNEFSVIYLSKLRP